MVTHITGTISYQVYSKTSHKQPLNKKTKIGFQGKLSLNAGQKYYRMLCGEYFALLSTFIQLSSVIKIFVLSTFEWPLMSGFTEERYFQGEIKIMFVHTGDTSF